MVAIRDLPHSGNSLALVDTSVCTIDQQQIVLGVKNRGRLSVMSHSFCTSSLYWQIGSRRGQEQVMQICQDFFISLQFQYFFNVCKRMDLCNLP